MDHRLPNPFNPADVWTPDELRRCLVARVPGVVDVAVSRNIDGELASRPELRHVLVAVKVLAHSNAVLAKQRALPLVALGCPPHVSATVTAVTVDAAPDPPTRPEPEVPRLRAEMTGLEPDERPPLWERAPEWSHALAGGCGVVAARIMGELGWLGW